MNCKEARRWMSPYLDSELGQTKTFEVSEHLRQCSKCTDRFGNERNVDKAMRSRLADTAMPAEQWSEFQWELAAPTWVRFLSGRRSLALAACLTIATISTMVALQSRDKHAGTPEIALRFVAEAPEGHPFQVSDGGADSVEITVKNEFGLQLASPADVEAMGHRNFQLVGASRRTDADGRSYVEVRLNCCGHPVLVTLARPVDGELPSPFDQLTPGLADGTAALEDGIKLAYETIGSVHVVVASRHPVEHILGVFVDENV